MSMDAIQTLARKAKRQKKVKPKTPQDISTQISTPSSKFLVWIASKTQSADARARLYERLASPLSSGVGIQVAIGQLYQRAAFKSETETMAIMLRYVLFSLNQGQSVSDGLAKFIPLNELLLLRAGEARGDLAGALWQAADTVRSVQKVRSAIMGAATKPSIMVSLLFVAMFIIGSFVMPKIASVFPMEEWKGGASVLALLSLWVNSLWFPATIAGLLGFAVVVFCSLKRWTGKGRAALDAMPPYSLYRVMQGAGWLTTLSSMLQAGRSIRDCLDDLLVLAKRDGNRYVVSRTARIIRENERGAENIGESMERAGYNFPDSEIIADLVMQSSLADFDQRIGVLASNWIDESVERVQKIASVMTSISLLAVGAFIMTFVLGVLSLNQQLASQMQSF